MIARNYVGKTKWNLGTVSRVTGKLHHEILDDGRVWVRHIDQVQKVTEKHTSTPESTEMVDQRSEELNYYVPYNEQNIVNTSVNVENVHTILRARQT